MLHLIVKKLIAYLKKYAKHLGFLEVVVKNFKNEIKSKYIWMTLNIIHLTKFEKRGNIWKPKLMN
jgi:hypothetical protein